jgi:hypothetical protein
MTGWPCYRASGRRCPPACYRWGRDHAKRTASIAPTRPQPRSIGCSCAERQHKRNTPWARDVACGQATPRVSHTKANGVPGSMRLNLVWLKLV